MNDTFFVEKNIQNKNSDQKSTILTIGGIDGFCQYRFYLVWINSYSHLPELFFFLRLEKKTPWNSKLPLDIGFMSYLPTYRRLGIYQGKNPVMWWFSILMYIGCFCFPYLSDLSQSPDACFLEVTSKNQQLRVPTCLKYQPKFTHPEIWRMDTELATQSTFLICYKGKWHFLLLMNAHHDWHQPAEYGPFLVHPRSLA